MSHRRARYQQQQRIETLMLPRAAAVLYNRDAHQLGYRTGFVFRVSPPIARPRQTDYRLLSMVAKPISVEICVLRRPRLREEITSQCA